MPNPLVARAAVHQQTGQQSLHRNGGDGDRRSAFLLPEPGTAASSGLLSLLDLERPTWIAEPHLLAAGFREAFESGPSLTLGVEEELLLLEPGTLCPAAEIDQVLERMGGDARFACEFRSAQLELITPVGQTVSDVWRELAKARALAVERLAGSVRLAAVGTHPCSTDPVVITGGERYAKIAAEHPWAIWRGLPSGLHVHVAVRGADRALAVFNAARSYIPELGALAANSPYFECRDTGLASARMKLNEDLPRSGTPPSFASWEELARFLSWGALGGTIPDATHLWWDLRPNLVYGTLEFRVADAQTRVRDTAAIAAVCQALVASLAARYDAGEQLPVHDTHRIQENRSRALRDGTRGELADLATGRPVATAERLAGILTDVGLFAEELGCRNELLHAWTLLERNGAERQRAFFAAHGLDSLVEWLVRQTETPARYEHEPQGRRHAPLLRSAKHRIPIGRGRAARAARAGRFARTKVGSVAGRLFGHEHAADPLELVRKARASMRRFARS
jgi:glutamate---cysteine ligase / carboxylate-amine ligase